jgi:hypothetical protein
MHPGRAARLRLQVNYISQAADKRGELVVIAGYELAKPLLILRFERS